MGPKSYLKNMLLRVSIDKLDGHRFVAKLLIMRFWGNRLHKNRRNGLEIENIRSVRHSSMHISGSDNQVSILGRINHCRIRVEGSRNTVSIQRGADVNWTELTVIANDSEILVGRGVFINGKESLQNLLLTRGEPSCITISDDCVVSYGVEARTSDSHKIYDSEGSRINPEANILIGKHVWIGARTTILKGCAIGENSIIATGSIVTNDVPPTVIAAGAPCRPIRSNIRWER